MNAACRRYTPAEDRIIRRRYPSERTADLARDLGRTPLSVYQRAAKLGLRKSAAFFAGPDSGRTGDGRGLSTRFQRGQQSWNKGVHYTAGGRSAETRFKPGSRPKTWVPVGTEVVDQGGYRKRKVRDDAPKGFSRYNWKFVHVLVWEEAHGPVPKGHAVVFRDGNREHIALDNLELVTRRALMGRNSVHNLPKELAQVVQLRGALVRKINRKERREEQDRRPEEPSVLRPRRAGRQGEPHAARPGKSHRRRGPGHRQLGEGGSRPD